ncbi:hypothetical protein LJK87_49915 [Paenibacillus sp. P25]|nr:hypothetical protein LJK87_49915 [Paenibacillus sp. P25]
MNEKNGPACGLTKQAPLEAVAKGETLSSIERAWGMRYNTIHVWVKKWDLKGINTEKARELLAAKSKPAPISKSTEEASQAHPHSDPSESTDVVIARLQVAYQELAELREQDNATAARILSAEVEQSRQKDEEIAALRAQVDNFATGILESDRTISELRGQIDRLNLGLETEEMETRRLKEALEGVAEVSAQAGARIRELEEERYILLETIESAAKDAIDSDFVTIRIPILPALTHPSSARKFTAVSKCFRLPPKLQSWIGS